MVQRLLSQLSDPGSILRPAYLISALIITLAWLMARRTGVRKSLKLIFSRDVWLRRSTIVDLGFCLFYLLVLRTAVKFVETTAFSSALGLGTRSFAGTETFTFFASPLIEGICATAVTMLSIDFASYAMHRWMHNSSLLWKAHRFHHSAQRLTPFTTYRQNPLEPLLLYGARGLAAGIGLAIFYRFFPNQTPAITVSGLGAGFFIYMFTVNLHHAPVPVRYPKALRAILVSPHVHHLHHSSEPRHHEANFGVVFSFWDRLFGTYVDEEVEPGTLHFGLKSDKA